MTDIQKMLDDARAYADEVWEDVVADIAHLVEVDSVEDKAHAVQGMPFGPGPHTALARALEVAQRLGLKTTDCDGYLGFCDLPGNDDRYIATIAHADIVPVGTGWDTDPLRVTRKGGYLLGRGVIDDKGPLVLSLYAAHYFVRRQNATGERLPLTLRCLVGSNEETGMEDVDYYLAHYPEPEFCFSPDASFPLIHGEKGHFVGYVSSPATPLSDARVLSLEGGTVPNAVPGQATAVVRATATPVSHEGISVEPGAHEGLYRINAQGIGGHASTPEGTINAIGLLCSYLLDHDLCSEHERAFLQFERLLTTSAYGEGLGVNTRDEAFGPLTCVGGIVRTDERDGMLVMRQSIDMRYPTSTDGSLLAERVRAVASEHGCELADWHDTPPFYQDPESREVRLLVDTYNRATGNDKKSITIGGGTYARHFTHAVAFGPQDPGIDDPDWVGQEHGPNEGVSEEALKRALAIYIVSIARLMA